METGNALSFAAVVISIAAVMISLLFGVRQVRLMRQANYVPAVVQLITEFRTTRLNDNFRYVCERLGQEHDPALGISGLPDDARTAVYDIVYYLSAFVTLSAFKIIRHETLLALFHHRIVAAWRAVEPFVVREREIGPVGPHMLVLLETFVDRYGDRVDASVARLLSEQFRT